MIKSKIVSFDYGIGRLTGFDQSGNFETMYIKFVNSLDNFPYPERSILLIWARNHRNDLWKKLKRYEATAESLWNRHLETKDDTLQAFHRELANYYRTYQKLGQIYVGQIKND